MQPNERDKALDTYEMCSTVSLKDNRQKEAQKGTQTNHMKRNVYEPEMRTQTKWNGQQMNSKRCGEEMHKFSSFQTRLRTIKRRQSWLEGRGHHRDTSRMYTDT